LIEVPSSASAQGPVALSDLYVLPVGRDYMVLSPLRQVAALLNRRAVIRLGELLEGGSAEGCPESLLNLADSLRGPCPDPPRERAGAADPVFLGLIPTRSCNLSCAYCGFGAAAASRQRMPLDTAVAAVDWMAERVDSLGRETLDVHFFGGEPFFAAEVVDVAVHRARAVAADLGLQPRFEVATNGFFDEERAVFAGDYIDSVVLSLDGPREVHDLHRPVCGGSGSFDTVARSALLLSRSPAELCVRVCVTQGSVVGLEHTIRWLCEQFQPNMIDLEPLQPTPESQEAGLEPPEPYAFAVHSVRARRLAKGHGVRAVYAAADADGPRASFCPVGQDALIVSPDGRVSGCYLRREEWRARGLDLDLGTIRGDGSLCLDQGAVQRMRRVVFDKPRCDGCFCRWSCAGGCHVSQTYPGCPEEYTDFCVQTRIITVCTLLAALGLEDRAEPMLDDHAALEALAHQDSDLLVNWNGGRA